MRIMEIISGAGVNGAIVASLETIRALIDRNHEITLVCRPASWIADQLATESVNIITSDLHRWPPDELRRIASIAREKRIEVLHTHMSRANFFGVLLRHIYGLPCVATAHNRYIQLHWMFNDHVIAVSKATKRFHRRFNLVRGSRIDVVHNSIDQHKFRRVSGSARADVRHKLSIDASIPLIGVVGDVIPRKGLLYLIRALPKILAVVPTAQLLVVGNEKTKYARVVREAATNLGVSRHITWAGLRSDIPKVLSALDLFVLPTLEDNLPLSVLEAMATGLPVVATTIGGLPECVISGETGTLVPSRKPAELATAINRLLQDSELCVRYGKSARRRVREHFSPESQSPRIEQVFRRVTG